MSSLKRAREVLKIEAEAILALRLQLDSSFDRAVSLIKNCKGRVVVTGVGKSGLIARKIASTLASTGTPALFLHPSEGVHGDLGVLKKNDVVLALSYNGASEELLAILPVIKSIGAKLITMTGKTDSVLAHSSDLCLECSVKEEACPMGLAPTASTTAALALGDALAVSVLEERDFKSQDFAYLHPKGSLGRKLTPIKKIMHKGTAIPLVKHTATVRKAVVEMTTKRMGCTGVVDGYGKLCGIFTDHDLRKLLQRTQNIGKLKISEVMNPSPKVVLQDELVAEAIRITESKSVGTLFVTDQSHRPVGIVHLHDLLRAN